MEINRRNFLCGALLTALGTSSTIVESAHATTGVKTLADGSVEVTLASIQSLGKVGGVALLGDVKGVPAALVRTATNKYVALNLHCTHAGVTVTPESGGFHCTSQRGGHGSRFSASGAVTNGPANAPLKKLLVKVTGKKILVS